MRKLAGNEYREEDWPHGLSCAECKREFREPDRYSERLDGMTRVADTEAFMLTIVCCDCAISSGTGKGNK